MLSNLIMRLIATREDQGDMRVFRDDMKPVDFEVRETASDQGQYGEKYVFFPGD